MLMPTARSMRNCRSGTSRSFAPRGKPPVAAAVNVNPHPLGIDVAHLQRECFIQPQAARIHGPEIRPESRPNDRAHDPLHFVAGEDRGQLRLIRNAKPALEPGPGKAGIMGLSATFATVRLKPRASEDICTSADLSAVKLNTISYALSWSSMPECPTFFGLNPRWYKRDQLYRFYVTSEMLCGAYVAGQIQDERTAALQLQALNLFVGGYVRRLLKRRADLEAQYDNMNPCSDAFLDADTRNFQILRRDVVSCTITHKRRLWTPNNTGTLHVNIASGEKRQFIIVGDQDARYVAESLGRFCNSINEVGHPIIPRATDNGA